MKKTTIMIGICMIIILSIFAIAELSEEKEYEYEEEYEKGKIKIKAKYQTDLETNKTIINEIEIENNNITGITPQDIIKMSEKIKGETEQ